MGGYYFLIKKEYNTSGVPICFSQSGHTDCLEANGFIGGLAKGLLEAVMGLVVVQLDDLDAADVVAVPRHLLQRTARTL